ncbi:MAG: hypothetical protein N2171_00790 [Clostridia bacterium]|nr:hypothetical protein [Clostridia bacterium]
MFKIDEVFKSEETKHRLTLFKTEYIQWLETQLFEKNGKPYLKCLASDRDRPPRQAGRNCQAALDKKTSGRISLSQRTH